MIYINSYTLDKLFSNWFLNEKWISTIIISFLVYYITKFYYGLKQYPKGPIPLPIIGNSLSFLDFLRIKVNIRDAIAKWSKEYGPVYTFWIGSKPFIIISDLKTANEAFMVKRNAIAGRPYISYLHRIFEFHNASDVVLCDYGPTWESLRRVAHDGIRKYSVGEKLALLVKDVVSETVDNIKKEGINKPFDPSNYIYLTLANIMASSIFGNRYSMKDEEFFNIINSIENFKKSLKKVFMVEHFPILKLFIDNSSFYMVQNDFFKLFGMAKQKYKNHQNDYQKELIRDLTDGLLAAKDDAIDSSKESAPYLTDNNLAVVLQELIIVGILTSHDILRWSILFMVNYPEIQRRMRKEIEDHIGDRIPIQNDRKNCHYINAFISECLRHRSLEFGVSRRTLCDVELNGCKIPKNTTVTSYHFSIMHNPDVFDSPDLFKPERFLDSDQHYLSTRHPGYIPFGIGRRKCPGEKLAYADLFLIIVNLLQLTSGYEFVLPNGPGSVSLEPDPNSLISIPLDYSILLKKVNQSE